MTRDFSLRQANPGLEVSVKRRMAQIDVYPTPWVTRHGSGDGTRILMNLGGKGLWYERQPGETRWQRVDDASEFDVLVNV